MKTGVFRQSDRPVKKIFDKLKLRRLVKFVALRLHLTIPQVPANAPGKRKLFLNYYGLFLRLQALPAFDLCRQTVRRYLTREYAAQMAAGCSHKRPFPAVSFPLARAAAPVFRILSLLPKAFCFRHPWRGALPASVFQTTQFVFSSFTCFFQPWML